MIKMEEYFNGLITFDELIYYLISEIDEIIKEELCKEKRGKNK